MSFELSASELDRMRADGYVVRESVFSADECADAITACEELVETLAKDRHTPRYTVGSYTFEPDMLEGVSSTC